MMRRLHLTEHEFFPNVVLAVAGAVSTLVLSNVFYHYAWIGDRHFTSMAGAVCYFVPPTALAFACFGALCLSPTHKQRVSVLCLALVVLVYGSDVVLEVTDVSHDGFLNRFARATAYGTDHTPDGNQLLAELQRSGILAVRAISTPAAPYDKSVEVDVSSESQSRAPELMPLSGIARRRTVACHKGDRWFAYDSDEHGFHNPPGLWTSHRVDIAAVGNSWTLASCVPSDTNFVSLIRRRYPATLNLGMNGEGPLQILAITKEYLSLLKPTVLIWFYSEGNSLRELQEEKKYELLLRYLNRDFTQGLIERQVEIDQALSAVAEDQKGDPGKKGADTVANAILMTLHRVSKVTSLRNALGLVYGTDAYAQPASADFEGPTMELFRQIVAAVRNQVSSWKGTLLFAYLPSTERYATGKRLDLSRDRQERMRVLQVVAEQEIPVIDLDSVFQTRGTSFFEQGGFSEAGHRVVAQHVLDAILHVPMRK